MDCFYAVLLSFSGFSMTTSTGSYSRERPDHRSGWRLRASAYLLELSRVGPAGIGCHSLLLIVENRNNCGNTLGLADLPGAFGVTPREFATMGTFAHEIGHNLGLCDQSGSIPSSSYCSNPGFAGHAYEVVARWYILGVLTCEGRAQTVMWDTLETTVINQYSNRNNTVVLRPSTPCS